MLEECAVCQDFRNISLFLQYIDNLDSSTPSDNQLHPYHYNLLYTLDTTLYSQKSIQHQPVLYDYYELNTLKNYN